MCDVHKIIDLTLRSMVKKFDQSPNSEFNRGDFHKYLFTTAGEMYTNEALEVNTPQWFLVVVTHLRPCLSIYSILSFLHLSLFHTHHFTPVRMRVFYFFVPPSLLPD